jgi:hypothetical protein
LVRPCNQSSNESQCFGPIGRTSVISHYDAPELILSFSRFTRSVQSILY